MNNSSRISYLQPGSVISPSNATLSQSVHDFASTAPNSMANVPLASSKWGKKGSFSSSRNLSPFKGPKGRIPEMMNMASEAIVQVSGRNSIVGGDSTSTFDSRRAISIQPTVKHKKHLSTPNARAKFNSSTLLAPMDLVRGKASESPKKQDMFQSTGTSFGFQGMFRGTHM